MKARSRAVLMLALVAGLILAACAPIPVTTAPAPAAIVVETALTAPPAPAPSPAPAASPLAGPAATRTAAGWQTFTNTEAGFSIMAPPTWNQQTLPDQNGGAIHGMAFTGPEGGVEVYWGVGFGGACSMGTEPVQVAQGELPACHGTNPDGTETWSQIGYEVSGGNSFSVRATTSNAQPSSRDLVLKVLSTLTFMPPAPPQAGAATPALPTAPAGFRTARNPGGERSHAAYSHRASARSESPAPSPTPDRSCGPTQRAHRSCASHTAAPRRPAPEAPAAYTVYLKPAESQISRQKARPAEVAQRPCVTSLVICCLLPGDSMPQSSLSVRLYFCWFSRFRSATLLSI